MMYDLVASVFLPWQGASSSHSGVGAHSNASVAPLEVCSPSDDSREKNVVDEFFQPVKKRVLVALEEAGVFTFGGLVKDKVLFCSTCYHLIITYMLSPTSGSIISDMVRGDSAARELDG
ncbi:hypothetical protein HN51_044614 [Arachis hypogaea]|nr:Peroxisome biogenesis protein [Arachis hypogaea]RYQ95281.1 hypothetical protein Ahy_B08g090359 isoform A [Arachis hypogaea]